jgi:glycosyltransferase involved in cell wall biosynthesis
LEEIAEAIAPIDLGLVPNRLNSFTRINLPTRIFEYLAMNKPVIAPRTRGVQDYFNEDELVFFEPGDAEDLTRKIEWVHRHPDETLSIVARGRKVYEKYSWDLEQGRFTGLVRRLVAAGEQPSRRAAWPKRVCMIAYSNYDNDNRVMRYAEELAQRGDSVEVLALRGDRMAGRSKTICGVRVFGIQSRARKDEKTRSSYLWPLLKFSAQAWAVVTWRHLRRPYDLVHVHNMPDFLVFTAWFPKLTGAKVILDIHDIVPEFYASKFDVPGHRSGVRMLKRMERASARFSHHVIISNHLWRDKFAARTGTESKCTVFVNNVNSGIFTPRLRKRRDGKFIIIFPGGLQWHQGLDIALRAFQIVSPKAPAAEFHIYGDGSMKQGLMELSRELGLEDKVRFFDPMPLRAIAEVMANADLGVVPKRADSFGNEAYSTKIMEFMSLGIPVVVSSTKIDRFYFDDSVVRFFESGNVNALAAAMLEMILDRNLRESMARRASEYAARNSWDTRKADYLNLVDSLCSHEEGGAGRLARRS